MRSKKQTVGIGVAMMGRLYRNPPIIEAVCEFRFEPSQTWDWTVIGLVYDRIKDEFPLKRQRNEIQLAIHSQGADIMQQMQMQFWRDDEKALVQVGVDLLTVNLLKPYPNWQTFKDLIARMLTIYRNITNPKGFQRVGLR
ncbi:MAG: TIGR04255 family protein [Armatimonadetes bacterium]|nr:TIGR04255 family protein [Armatimonadota bacterium]MDW8028546.1 TIGR04255 family protein [Armatimonadota bacterium]